MVHIVSLIRVCPGKRHAWYMTAFGIAVRKPIGQKVEPREVVIAGAPMRIRWSTILAILGVIALILAFIFRILEI